MGTTILVERNATNVELSLTVSPTVPAATAVVEIRDASAAQAPLPLYLDFSDQTFKTVGWVTKQAALTALAGSANRFALDGGLDIATITNLPATTRWLVAEYEATVAGRIFQDNDVLDLRELCTQTHIGATFQPPAGGTTRFTAWLNRKGTTVTAGLISCTIDFFDPTGGVLLFTEVVLAADAQGHFDVTHLGDLLTAGNPFYLITTIVDAEGSVATHRTTPFT